MILTKTATAAMISNTCIKDPMLSAKYPIPQIRNNKKATRYNKFPIVC